jgi:hypothetical protein
MLIDNDDYRFVKQRKGHRYSQEKGHRLSSVLQNVCFITVIEFNSFGNSIQYYI